MESRHSKWDRLALAACGALALIAVPTAAAHPGSAGTHHAPQAETTAATGVAATAVTLNGVVTPHHTETRYYFEYGTTGYDRRTAELPAGDGHDPLSVSVRVEGLKPATAYKARIVAFARPRTDVGNEITFTTLAPAGPAAPLSAFAPVSQVLAGSAAPILGRTVTVLVRTGDVSVRVPGASGYVPLTGGASVPVGSLVNTRRGSVTLLSARSGGATQSGTFRGGLFEIRQPRTARGTTELVIRGRSAGCPSGTPATASRRRKRRRAPRALWGNVVGGSFRTRGKNSVATVRGTIWYVEDRCSGTLTRVRRGSVSVRDLRRKRTVIVRAGRSYLARTR